MARLAVLACLLALLGLGACGGGTVATGATEAGVPDLAPVVSPDDGGSDGGGADGPRDCADDLGARARGGACVRSVTGRLTSGGAPLPGALVTVCAAACFYGTTDVDGRFVVTVGQYIEVELYSLLAHANPRLAVYYLALPPPVEQRITIADPVELLPMPLAGPAIRDDGTAQTLAQGGVTLELAQGTTLFLSFEDASELPLGAELRPLRVTQVAGQRFLGGLVPEVLYGFGPFEIVLDRKARLTFDNPAGLPAGAAVEVLVQRGLAQGGPPGWRFDVVAAAHVSQDGARIELDPGEGVLTLTWIALRRKGS